MQFLASILRSHVWLRKVLEPEGQIVLRKALEPEGQFLIIRLPLGALKILAGSTTTYCHNTQCRPYQ